MLASKAIAFRDHGRVAQLVEQRTENPCVEGSSPPPTTIIKKGPGNGALFMPGGFHGAYGPTRASHSQGCPLEVACRMRQPPRAFSLQVSQLHDAVFVEGIAGRAVFGMSYAAGVREGDVGGRVVSQGSRRERVPDALHMGVPAENE